MEFLWYDNRRTEAIRALSENRMAGEVVVTGQDADLKLLAREQLRELRP